MPADKSKADAAKDKGNKAFAAKQFVAAISAFTDAIAEDPTNHVFYSNRSAAFLKNGQVPKAVADAEKCVAIKPDWYYNFLCHSFTLPLTNCFLYLLGLRATIV
jgi:Flp pilus assembly protein TadD